MNMLANWMCYAPQGDPPRYAATSRMSSALSVQSTALFIRHAEETLHHLTQVALPLWQYVGSGEDGPSVLMRATTRIETTGEPAGVIWGLMLPRQYVTSPHFALQACVDVFPPDDISAPWPAAVDLTNLTAAAPDSEAAPQLAAAYAEAGELRVPVPAGQAAVAMLCQLLELLPPGDRAQISFATAPLGLRRVEVDPDVLSAPQPSGAALARLQLWNRIKRVLDTVDTAASLRQDPETWLTPLLLQSDLPGRVTALLRQLASEDLSAELWQTALAWLRRALEQSLTDRADCREVTSTLEELCHSGLLARHDIFPPLWPARIALKLQVLGSLTPQTLAQILRPDPAQLLQLVLTGLRRGPAAGKTVDLVAALARAPASVNRQLFDASEETLTQLCAQPQRLQHDAELATALAVLAMYTHGRRDGPGAAGQ